MRAVWGRGCPTPLVEPPGTCARSRAAILGLRQAGLLQAALQEAIIVDSPGPSLGPLRGALTIQAHVLVPGAREAAGGRQAEAPSPRALLFLWLLGAQMVVPLVTQRIIAELRGQREWVLASVARVKSSPPSGGEAYVMQSCPRRWERMGGGGGQLSL